MGLIVSLILIVHIKDSSNDVREEKYLNINLNWKVFYRYQAHLTLPGNSDIKHLATKDPLSVDCAKTSPFALLTALLILMTKFKGTLFL